MGKTIAEKIFDSHCIDKPSGDINVVGLDAIFCHEITTPGAINDLISRGKDRVFEPDKIKAVIDHVSPAKDSKTALQGKIIREWAMRHKIRDFFDIGRNGVCHAIFPEKGFVRPGYIVIMGDSHTCTHGAFGAFAAGVGTTDLEVGILKGVCAFHYPETIRININGNLKKGVYAKDVILSIIGCLGVNGATNRVIEFSGPVIKNMNMESRMTICNMAVEAGATSGICEPDSVTVDFLWEFIKEEFADRRYGIFSDNAHIAFRQGRRTMAWQDAALKADIPPERYRLYAKPVKIDWRKMCLDEGVSEDDVAYERAPSSVAISIVENENEKDVSQ